MYIKSKVYCVFDIDPWHLCQNKTFSFCNSPRYILIHTLGMAETWKREEAEV